jgi:two-component system, chemotaxis family, sensor kinase CheA
MADTQVNALLQEMATEMAFLSPDSAQGLALIAAVLEQLQEQQAVTGSADAGRELALCQTLCQPAASGAGLSQPQLEQLQSAFERMSNALYLVKPTQEDPLAQQLDSAGLSGQAQNAQDQVNPQAQQAQDSEGTEGRFFIGADDDLELLNEFCNEGRDLLGQVEQGVLVLEENPRHKDTLNQVFRAFHTFKGGAGFLGIAPIQLLAHHLESLLDAARKDQLPINQAVIDVILAGGDALQKYVSAIARQLAGEDRGQAIFVDTSELLVRIEACLRGESAPAASAATPPQVSDLPALPDLPDLPPAEPVAMPAVQPAAAAELLAQHKPPVVLASAAPPVAAPAPAPDKSAGSGKPAPAPAGQASKVAARTEALANFVKLDTHKLDALVDLMGELVIAQSMVVQHSLVQQLRDRELDRHLRQLSRITTDLQRNAMSLRMVPIRSTFQKMNRLVRDLAAAQHKQVQLVLSGEDTELDRNIVEELADPLLHMMRNAVDHGIESPADRLAAGKSAQGTIELHATHQGGGILIRLRDDGRGLDTQRILSKALQKGLITAEDAPTDKSIFNLIFLPGFSTAEAVTDISGRGVGMDVVRGNIARLRGRIDITSALGQGTTFEIFLPLTLAIIDGMLVGVGPERFIVPTLTIRESLRPQPQMVSTVQGKGELIRVRDKLIPLVRLSDKLGLVSQVRDPCEGIVMVVDSGARSRALLVDSLIGKQEVVIKSLGQTFKHQQGMSGAAILGDGRVALIIDPEAVSQLGSASEMAA